LTRGNPKSKPNALLADERPFAVQIFGGQPENADGGGDG
jgi:hypothetical protein